ncbi:MAG: molybdopterin molybdotransferase MoeA, partial [Phaeodactylibacter sp.]|nr:molybdopterin molybdotransferase MoeA [Phaeodactylibacter sp.]
MISVDEATKAVLAEAYQWHIDNVPFDWAMNRVLAEDLYADRDFPPFNRVAMDGISIQYQQFVQGQRSFPIAGVAAAGAPQLRLDVADQCMEVMTGCVLPGNTDTVIRYEDLDIVDGVATITIDEIQQGQNIHPRGLDKKEGDLVVPKGTKMSSAEIGVAATVGRPTLKVLSPPATIIISTGDELVNVHERPLPHQIRRSNVYRIGSTLRSWGLDPVFQHLPDNRSLLLDQLSNILAIYKLVILSGGVSKGKFDYLPGVLEELGVKQLFHRVAQRPGKPFWFGQAPAGATIFALPGNPVSSFMCTHRYVNLWLEQCKGLDPLANRPHARLMEDFEFKPNLTYFLQVRLKYLPDGTTGAYPV